MFNFLFYAAVIALGIFGADVLNMVLRTILMKLAVRRLNKQLALLPPNYGPLLPMLPMRYPDEPYGGGGSNGGVTH